MGTGRIIPYPHRKVVSVGSSKGLVRGVEGGCEL